MRTRRFALPHLPARPTRRVASGVVLTCFGIGIAGAFGAHAVETNIAESDARTAAHELEAKRSALEGELNAAHDAVHDAQDVVGEDRVAQAAHTLSRATRTATESAAVSGVRVSVAPLDPEEIAQLVDHAKQQPAAPAATENTVVVADVVGSTPQTDNTGDRSAGTPVDAGSSSVSPPSAASAHPLPALELERDVVAEADVAKVLAGDADNAEEAREATQRLEQAAAALDEAARAVGSGADALSEAALEAAHLDTLDAIDTAMTDAEATLSTSTALIAAVSDQVRQPAPLVAAQRALVEFDSAAATAALVDRDSPERVIEEFGRLTETGAALASAMEELRTAHEAWIVNENQAIDARNEIVRAEHEAAVADAREAHAEANRAAVAARPNGWKGQPVGVAGSNGALSTASMCRVDFAPGHRLQCDAARALEDADATYHAQTGRHLTMTDSYRSFGLQVRTRALKPSTAARPGTSNHGWGMAVDLDRPSSAWLAANGAEFGWVHPAWARPGGVRPEFWHLEYVATDVGAYQAPASAHLESHVTSAFESSDSDSK